MKQFTEDELLLLWSVALVMIKRGAGPLSLLNAIEWTVGPDIVNDEWMQGVEYCEYSETIQAFTKELLARVRR